MTAEVLEEFDLSEGALGQDFLAEHIGDLFDGDAIACLHIGRGTDHGQSDSTPSRKTTYQTMPYAP